MILEGIIPMELSCGIIPWNYPMELYPRNYSRGIIPWLVLLETGREYWERQLGFILERRESLPKNKSTDKFCLENFL